MPELPEVEVVRAGLAKYVTGRTVVAAEVLHPRAIRRYVPGDADFSGRLAGQRIEAVSRRGKYLWFELSSGDAMLGHLGMSGQLLVQSGDIDDGPHLRIRLRFADDGTELRFVDQRTFGGFTLTELVDVDGTAVPEPIAHIARDPMDARFDPSQVVVRLRAKRTEVKRALLDQTLISGIGNIYADEALWRAKLHGTRPTGRLAPATATRLLHAASEVMTEALAAGGTSFDSLYVNVNGSSGYFSRSLNVYGREDEPCGRCGALIRREKFTNRSSYFCPRCQPRPRRG
ncbi:bifunctional DNA-formamidopyrimidine glycosylase/DNA-(apurinic or apyrimidinic site) lyase [Haloechinothrix salitolerans]|uniref:Formamidopyrimidine-DNA glycosylase n=1 Tax=Haloechinothrix salitolerans TaxID=926830 RepID=A0ABW2C6E1_9PSEU